MDETDIALSINIDCLLLKGWLGGHPFLIAMFITDCLFLKGMFYGK